MCLCFYSCFMTKSSTCFLKVTRKLLQFRWYEKYCEKEVLNFTDLHKRKYEVFSPVFICVQWLIVYLILISIGLGKFVTSIKCICLLSDHCFGLKSNYCCFIYEFITFSYKFIVNVK